MDKEVNVDRSLSMGLFRRAALQARIDALTSSKPVQPASVQRPSENESTGAMTRPS